MFREEDREHDKLGFSGKYNRRDYNFVLRIKGNKGGIVMGILVRSGIFTSGRRYMCIPRGENGCGWANLAKIFDQLKKLK